MNSRLLVYEDVKEFLTEYVFSLPSVFGKEDMVRKMPCSPGVYFFVYENTVTYVGTSSNLFKRLSDTKHPMRNCIKNMRVYYDVYSETEESRRHVDEALAILIFLPENNQ